MPESRPGISGWSATIGQGTLQGPECGVLVPGVVRGAVATRSPERLSPGVPLEDPMLYVPRDRRTPADSPVASGPIHRAVRSLYDEAGRHAWATRALPSSAHATREGDPLVGLLAQLRAAVTRFVYQLRAEGAPPERVLVEVKRHVREAMAGDGWLDPAAVQALTAEAVRWSIEAYYDRAADR